MRGRYFYFCSGGSIFTVSTVGRRGRRRMGKYMKKAKSVQNMEVSQSSLLGVRTRARALALEKQTTSESIRKHSFPSSAAVSKPRKSSQSRTIPSKIETHYMQLRRRRLEKVARHYKKGRESEGDGHNENELESARDRSVDQASAVVLPSISRPSHVELRLLNEELPDMPARNSCSSRPDFVFVGVPGIEDVSHSRVTSPAQSSLHASNHAAPVAISTQMQGRGASRMVTRHQKQELDSKLSADGSVMVMEFKRETPEAASPSGNVQREIEVGPCSGESPMIAGPSVRERQQGPNTRSQKRECTLDNLTHNVEVAGSISKTGEPSQMKSSSAPPHSRSNEAPFSTEIEAFFASAEQKERRRFIDKYNFDPLTEKPLKGRYVWLKE